MGLLLLWNGTKTRHLAWTGTNNMALLWEGHDVHLLGGAMRVEALREGRCMRQYHGMYPGAGGDSWRQHNGLNATATGARRVDHKLQVCCTRAAQHLVSLWGHELEHTACALRRDTAAGHHCRGVEHGIPTGKGCVGQGRDHLGLPQGKGVPSVVGRGKGGGSVATATDKLLLL